MGPLKRTKKGLTAKNTVVVSPGRLDRSPCGTGTCARLAVMHAKKLVKPGEVIEVKTLVTHEMESGHRRDSNGALVPRRIINRLTCSYNGRPVFEAALEDRKSTRLNSSH